MSESRNYPGLIPFLKSNAKTIEEFNDKLEAMREEKAKQESNQTDEERALKAAAAYARLLRVRHPQWSPAKLQKKVCSHLNIKLV